MKDANGTELKIGDVARHKHDATGEGYGAHYFAAPAKIERFISDFCVEVKGVAAGTIPIYCASLVTKVDGPA